MGLKLDWLGDDQRVFLERGYLSNSPTPEDRYQEICENIYKVSMNMALTHGGDSPWTIDEKYQYSISGIGSRFEKYIENNWISFASPILSNFGAKRGLPISCNHGKIDDTMESIVGGIAEVCLLAKNGAGTAKNFSNIRAKGEPISGGGKSDGVMKWIELYAHAMSSTTQGSVRRGFLTAYLSVDHAEILDFLTIGTKAMDKERSRHFQTITTAVTIPKGWMQSMIDGDKDKRKIWGAILKVRNEIGYPYILFEDNCNINSPQVYKDKGVWIDNANICIEAVEYCDSEKEFACCLSSVNVTKFDEWKDNSEFIMDVNVMLDCVIEEYITKGKSLEGLQRAIKFAEEHRAIGVGILGFHSYLQSKNIAFGSLQSYSVNNQIFSTLREYGDKASKYMAEMFGEPTYMKGTGYRNSSRMAQAPTKSSAFIMGGWSEGIEPIKSNFHEKSLSKVQVEYKNPYLKELLKEKGQDSKETWRSILVANGSVQHLTFLTEHEKDVFKTFSEISQMDVINLAAQRQKHIDMAQSINVMIHPEATPKSINELYITAWKEGVKSLYYQHSINGAQEFNKELMQCSSCEG